MTKPQLDSGTPRLLAGRYQLLEQLDSGGMASVWKGHDQVLGRDVAIKLLREDLAADAGFAARFRQEAVHAANLNHPGIVGVFDIGAHDGVPYIVMELVDGRTIRQLLAREGPLPPAQAARIALGVAQALAYAHRLGVVHHNLKPANIMLTQAGVVKVADFSIARAVDSEDPDRTGELLGPVSAYLAPEQRDGQAADGRADVYALGACLFEMLTGKPPAALGKQGKGSAPSPRMLRAGIPRGLDEIVRKAMASDPADRFASAQDLVAALRAEAGRPMPRPLPAPVPPAPVPPGPPGRQAARPGAATQAPADRTPPQPVRAAPGRPAAGAPVAPPVPGVIGARPAGAGPRRWLGPAVAAGVVVTAIALLAVTSNLLPERDRAVGGTTPPPSTTAGQAPTPLETEAVGSIDPVEQGGESNEDVGRATDGDPSTEWRTETYTRANFGNFKAGIGLILRGEGAARRLQLRLGGDGGSAKIFAADQPYLNGQTIPVSDPLSARELEGRLTAAGWVEVASERPLEQETTFELPGEEHGYYLVWVTGLPQVEATGWRLAVREARLLS